MEGGGGVDVAKVTDIGGGADSAACVQCYRERCCAAPCDALSFLSYHYWLSRPPLRIYYVLRAISRSKSRIYSLVLFKISWAYEPLVRIETHTRRRQHPAGDACRIKFESSWRRHDKRIV